MLGMHEYEILTVFLLNNLWYLWLLGKLRAKISKNLRPMFVDTLSLYGGLYHKMLRRRFFFWLDTWLGSLNIKVLVYQTI